MKFVGKPLKNAAFYCNDNACSREKYLFHEISLSYTDENETFFLNDNEILIICA